MESSIKGDTYLVEFTPEEHRIRFKGSLRLNGLQEYAPLAEMLSGAGGEGASLVVDLQELEFLNSSGIAMLSKFVIEARNNKMAELIIRGAQSVAWQGKSLVNLQRLMPALKLEIL